MFVLEPGEDFVGGVNLRKDLSLEGVNSFLFCCNTGYSVLEGFEVGVPFRGAKEINVLALVRVVQKLKEIVDRKGFARGRPWINSGEPGFGSSFRLGGERHGFRC